MPNYNKVTIIGHMVREPSLKYTGSGTALIEGTVAVNHKYKDVEEVAYLDFTKFGDVAEKLAEMIDKGDAVFIEGRLKQNKWEDRDGNKRSKIVIIADVVLLLGKSRNNDDVREDESQTGDKDIPF